MITPRRPKSFRHFGSPVKSHNPTASIINVSIILVVVGFLIWVLAH